MSGSGAWARNDLDDMVAAPPRPASLSISNSTSTNTASTVKVWVYKSQTSSGIFNGNPGRLNHRLLFTVNILNTVLSPTSDSTLSPTVKESLTESIDRDTKSYLNDDPTNFTYEQFTVRVI